MIPKLAPPICAVRFSGWPCSEPVAGIIRSRCVIAYSGCSLTRASVGALTRCFFDCSSGCEFCLSGYVTALGNDFGWQARLSGIEKFLDRVTWCGELVRDRFVGKMDFAETKRGQLVNAFMDC